MYQDVRIASLTRRSMYIVHRYLRAYCQVKSASSTTSFPQNTSKAPTCTLNSSFSPLAWLALKVLIDLCPSKLADDLNHQSGVLSQTTTATILPDDDLLQGVAGEIVGTGADGTTYVISGSLSGVRATGMYSH